MSAGFAPWRARPHRVRPHIDSASDQVLQLICHSRTEEKKTLLCARCKKLVYFSSFNQEPLKVTDELEIESLGWVHEGKLGGGELAMGRNLYKPVSLRTMKSHQISIGDFLQDPNSNHYKVHASTDVFILHSVNVSKVSCKNLLDAGNTASGSYSLRVNGNSFQVGFLRWHFGSEFYL